MRDTNVYVFGSVKNVYQKYLLKANMDVKMRHTLKMLDQNTQSSDCATSERHFYQLK